MNGSAWIRWKFVSLCSSVKWKYYHQIQIFKQSKYTYEKFILVTFTENQANWAGDPNRKVRFLPDDIILTPLIAVWQAIFICLPNTESLLKDLVFNSPRSNLEIPSTWNEKTWQRWISKKISDTRWTRNSEYSLVLEDYYKIFCR